MGFNDIFSLLCPCLGYTHTGEYRQTCLLHLWPWQWIHGIIILEITRVTIFKWLLFKARFHQSVSKEFKLFLPSCCLYLSPCLWPNLGIYSLLISKARMPVPRLDLQTVGSVEILWGQLVWTHLNSVEDQLLAQAKYEQWLRLTFAQVIMGYYNSHLTCVLCPWKPGSVMTQSERSVCIKEPASPPRISSQPHSDDSSIQLWLLTCFTSCPPLL